MQESKFLKENAENIKKMMDIPSLKEFEPEILGGMLKISKIRKYEAGECLIKEGDNDSWLYFLLSGGVKITKQGKEITRLKRKGDMIGEMGSFGANPRSASAVATEPTICLTTDTALIDKLSESNRMAMCSLLYRSLAEVVTDRLRATSNLLVKAKEEISILTQIKQ